MERLFDDHLKTVREGWENQQYSILKNYIFQTIQDVATQIEEQAMKKGQKDTTNNQSPGNLMKD